MRFEFGDLYVPEKITPGWLRYVLIHIGTAINSMDERNFPNPINGDVLIAQGTLSGSALKRGSVELDRLTGEIFIPLLLVHPPVSTTSSTPVNVGPYFRWRPYKWPATGTWYLEVSAYSANSAATTTVGLRGEAQVGVVTFTETAMTWKRSSPLTMPATEQNLWVTLQTSNTSYAANLAGARLVYSP